MLYLPVKTVSMRHVCAYVWDENSNSVYDPISSVNYINAHAKGVFLGVRLCSSFM